MAKTTDPWANLRPILGATFINSIDDSNPEYHPLRIGSQSWSRHQLATELGVVHTHAAVRLSHFAAEMKARNVKDLWERTSSYQLARESNCGVTTLYVAWRVFEYVGLDASTWYSRGRDDAIRTFLTIKHRLQRQDELEKREARKAARKKANGTTP